jgi:putative aldouronate transport system permease protein
MALKRNAAERAFDFVLVALMLVLMILMVYPLVYAFLASFSDGNEMIKHRGLLFSFLGFSLEAYKRVFENEMILIGYRNTLTYILIGTTVNVALTSLAAYALSRRCFRYRNLFMFMFVFTMFFNGGLIPTFLVVKGIGLYDKLLAMVLPNAISTWNLVIMRTSMAGLPDSLEESARIDGANDLVILWHIVLPLSTAVLAVMILFYGVGHWNAWFNAMVYLRGREKYPLQLILREILISNSTDLMTSSMSTDSSVPIGETIKYATIMVATVPILCVYPMLQKYFVKGVMIGAIKG